MDRKKEGDFDVLDKRKSGGETVVTTFGRFNPVTVGHIKLVNRVAQEAQNRSGTYRIYLSHSQDRKKNPLSYRDKVKFLRKAAPKHRRNIIESRANNILEVATELYEEGYGKLVIVVGQDRVKSFRDLIERYNGVDSRHGFYDYNSIDVVSAGDRDPDAEGIEGMSASKLREFAMDGDFESFASGLPDTLSDSDKSTLYDKVREGLGIRENVGLKGFSTFLEETQEEDKDDTDAFLEEVVDPDFIHYLYERVSNKQLKEVEKFADKLFNKLGIDVKFSKHFKDRVNDPRNKKDITAAELIRIFKDTFRRYGKTIKQMGADAQAVIKDITTNINIPIALNADPRDEGEIDMVSKTIMRKPNFMTSNPTLQLNQNEWRNNLKRISESILQEARKSDLTAMKLRNRLEKDLKAQPMKFFGRAKPGVKVVEANIATPKVKKKLPDFLKSLGFEESDPSVQGKRSHVTLFTFKENKDFYVTYVYEPDEKRTDITIVDARGKKGMRENFITEVSPRSGESQEDFHSRCMSYMVGDEGYDQDQANAICYSKWENRD